MVSGSVCPPCVPSYSTGHRLLKKQEVRSISKNIIYADDSLVEKLHMEQDVCRTPLCVLPLRRTGAPWNTLIKGLILEYLHFHISKR